MPFGGGGGGGGPSTATSYQTNLPEYARPYVETMLGATQKQLFEGTPTEGGGFDITGFRPYEPYSGQKVASFSPLQRKAQEQAFLLEPSSDYSTGSRMAFRAGDEAFDRSRYNVGQFGNQFQAPGAYVPGQFDAQQVQAPGLTQYQMAAPERVSAAQVGTPTMGAAQTGYTPSLQSYQIGLPSRVETPTMGAAQTGFDPRLTAFQMAAPERVGTESFTQPGTAERYMSPYMEQAIAPQLREARRASDIQAAQIGAEAAKQGAFGGGRAAILEAERRRNLATQTGDIRARGLQQAYDQAQQLYGTEQQRAMQAQLANQQAGLTAGGQNLAAQLGVQQLGTQTGLQTALANLSSQQQANVQNQAAALQTQGLNAQQALQTALANQQAALGTQQLGTQTGLQTALANLSSQQQANVQNQAAALQAQGLNAQQAMQAALANQQAGLTAGQTNLQALLGTQQLGAGQSLQAQLANQQALQQSQQLREQSRQFGAGQGLQAAGLGAQYGLAAQQLGEQSRQYGAGLGLQGLQTAQQSAGLLGQLAQQRFAERQGVLGLQSQLGAQQQALEQQRISQAMQDYATAQQYPLMQLGFMSNMLRGLPMQAVNTQQYMAQPSYLTQGLGALGAGASIYNAFGRGQKEGGQVKGYDVGGEVREDLEQMDNAALQRYIKESQSETAKRIAQRILRERGPGMAGGGIVAFAKGSDGPVTGLPGSLMGLELGEESIAAEQATPEQIREMSTRELQEYNRTGKIPERLVDLPQEDVARAIDRQMAPAVGRGIGTEPKTDMAGARPPAAPAPAAAAAPAAAPARAGLKLEDFMDQDAPTPQGLLDLQQQSDEAKSLARKTQAEHLADIRKEYGNLASSKARQDYRQKVMEERANAKDEARRNRDLLMAQMFADMATRPGPVLVAMMGSVKDRLPDVIANEKDLKKAQREMDRVVFELDEATRLEERGLADKAYARKEDALKRVNDLSVRYATQSVELEKSREASRAAGRRAFQQERGATERTQMEVGARERGTEATERARELSAATANLNNARTNLANAQSKANTALLKNTAYVNASNIVNQLKNKSDLNDEQKRVLANSQALINEQEAKIDTELAGFVADVNNAEAYFKSLMPQRATQARQQSTDRLPLSSFERQ